jgi:YihY family inner membrane protein
VGGEGRDVPRGNPIERVAARANSVVEAAYATRPGAFAKEIMDRAGAAGGGITANGIAYSAIFTIVPTLLLLASLIGMFISDPAERERIVEIIATQIPPLEDLMRTILNEVASGAFAFGIIGIIGAIWGASRFYAALETAVALFFPHAPRRDVVQQTLRSLLSVGFFVGSAVGAVVLTTFVSDLGVMPRPELEPIFRRIVAAVAMVAWFTFGISLVYKYLPSVTVRWRDSLPPSIVAGVAVGILTQAFVIVTPIFLRGLRFYGTFVAIFAALIWLSFSCQVVVYGLAWLAERMRAPLPEAARLMLGPRQAVRDAGAASGTDDDGGQAGDPG